MWVLFILFSSLVNQTAKVTKSGTPLFFPNEEDIPDLECLQVSA